MPKDQTTDLRARIDARWREPYGDRRQELVLIGEDLDEAALRARLDACLLSDEEMGLGQLGWRYLSDPLPGLRWRGLVEAPSEP